MDVFGRSQRFERAITPESRNLRQGLFGSGPAQPGPELPLGQLTAIVDGLGRTTTYAFKGEGGKQRLSRLTDAMGGVTHYEHNLPSSTVKFVSC